MKRKLYFIILTLILITSCSSFTNYKETNIYGEMMLWDGLRVKEGKADIAKDIKLSSFKEERFSFVNYPVIKEKYSLEDTSCLHIHSENPGPAIYIVSGVHADEKAGWIAASLLEEIKIKCGDLYIIAPANKSGQRKNSRYVKGGDDLNRAFPGDLNGKLSERIAAKIYEDIKSVNPVMVLDLHEANFYQDDRENLGSTYIFTILDGIDELFFKLINATEKGEICHNEFSYVGPGAKGSLNSTVSDNLGIPVITVETFMGYNLSRRVSDQLDSVYFALRYFGLID